jgi:hypothetical protein
MLAARWLAAQAAPFARRAARPPPRRRPPLHRGVARTPILKCTNFQMMAQTAAARLLREGRGRAAARLLLQRPRASCRKAAAAKAEGELPRCYLSLRHGHSEARSETGSEPNAPRLLQASCRKAAAAKAEGELPRCYLKPTTWDQRGAERDEASELELVLPARQRAHEPSERAQAARGRALALLRRSRALGTCS